MGRSTFSRQRGGTGTSGTRASCCNRGLRSTQYRSLGWQMKCLSCFSMVTWIPHPKEELELELSPWRGAPLCLLPPFLPLSHLHLSCIRPSRPLVVGRTSILEQDKMALILTCKKGSALCGTRHLPMFIALQIRGAVNKWERMHIPKEQWQWTTIKKI